MSRVAPQPDRHVPPVVRPAFVVALALCMGGATAALQVSQPVREALGIDPIIRPLSPEGARQLVPPRSVGDSVRLDHPGAAQTQADDSMAAPVRRLGSGTRRAMALPPALQPDHAQPGETATGRVEPRGLVSRHDETWAPRIVWGNRGDGGDVPSRAATAQTDRLDEPTGGD